MKNKLNIGLLFLVMALIAVPGVSAHANYDMACTDCHALSNAISVTATTPKTTVAPGESFVVTVTWSPSSATAKWPSVVNDNALFGIPSGGVIVSGSGTGTTTLKAPSAAGSYKVTVYASAFSGGLITNFKDIVITVQAATVDTSRPSVTINQAATQADPTGTSPINFTVVFNESVTGFATGDVTLSGTAGATTATVTGSGATYNVAVSGMTTSGTVTATIASGVAQDAAGNLNTASTSTDNTVTYNLPDTSRPSVTINQAATQADPTSTSPINFAVVFNESVTGFATGDVTISGTAGATTATVTGSGATYNVAVTGMSASGTVIATIASGVAQDAAGNLNTASTSTDNTVTYTIITPPPADTSSPTVTINQASGQADPTSTSPINFAVVFNESVTGFATGDVTLSGTAGATTATVTGSGATYNVAVSGMTTSGTVTATIASGVAQDAAGNLNTASTSTDNTVTYTIITPPPADTSSPTVTINQASGQADPTSTSPINFVVVFNESVTGFATGDVTLSGTAGATTATVTGSGATYNVAVTGMLSNGTVIATIASGVAQDAAGNLNTASTSTDNIVNYTRATPPPSTEKARVTFIVVDSRGHRIEDARVSMNGTTIKTNHDGKAIFTNIVLGTYSYKVTKRGYSDIVKSIVVKGDMTVKVTLTRSRDGEEHR